MHAHSHITKQHTLYNKRLPRWWWPCVWERQADLLVLANMWIWASWLFDMWNAKAWYTNLVCFDAYALFPFSHTHTRWNLHQFCKALPVCHSVCVCVLGKWASELDGKGGSAGSNESQRSGRWETNQKTHKHMSVRVNTHADTHVHTRPRNICSKSGKRESKSLAWHSLRLQGLWGSQNENKGALIFFLLPTEMMSLLSPLFFLSRSQGVRYTRCRGGWSFMKSSSWRGRAGGFMK